MTDKPLEQVLDELHSAPAGLSGIGQSLPRSAGLYAWWAPPEVLPDFPGTPNDADPGLRLLYLGIATTLRSRVAGNHLARSGTSTLRRTLAGLLLTTERYRTTWTDRVVLVPEDEPRLTAWMQTNLWLTWSACAAPRQHERTLITLLRPPLNVAGALPSQTRDQVRAAKAAYAASAGRRP